MRDVSVRDVMTSDVISVKPGTAFKEMVRMMARRRISGLPVVDAGGGVVGVVTEPDLLRAESGTERRGLRPLRWLRALFGRSRRVEDLRAEDLMSRDVVSVPPTTSMREAARRLVRAGTKRLVVVDEDRLAGVVTGSDLLRPFLREDAEIMADVTDVVRRSLWLDPATLVIRVRDGVVRLAGEVERRTDKDFLIVEVHGVPGVVGVEDDLTYELDDRRIRPSAIDTARIRTTSLPRDFTPGALR